MQIDGEQNSAKNTANVLPVMSKNINSIDHQDIEELKESIKKPGTAVLFPTESSRTLKSYPPDKLKHLIVLDGTWRKAKRFYLSNEWLQACPTVCLSDSYKSLYSIRKTTVTNGLSTLEAIAYSLNEIEQTDIAPFLNLLNGINKQFTQYMPDEVKARYD